MYFLHFESIAITNETTKPFENQFFILFILFIFFKKILKTSLIATYDKCHLAEKENLLSLHPIKRSTNHEKNTHRQPWRNRAAGDA